MPYNPKEIEQWYKENYKYFFGEGDKILIIDTPPPYPAPLWHIGAALSYALQDFIARGFRKLGYKVIFPEGFDGNGIPIEMYLEKYEKIPFGSIDREEYIKKCRQILDSWREKMDKILKDLLLSMDFEHRYNTDDPEYRALTQKTFAELWEKGLIYEAEYPINYCPHCKTAIADAEIERKIKKTKLVYIKFKIKDSDDYITVATTRPELLGACKAIIVHPDDERYKKYHNKIAIVPYYNREIPIIPHKMADPNFGTGAVMICSYGDWVDVQIFRELQLKPEKIIDENGRLTIEPVKGLTTKEGREKMIEVLKQLGVVEKIEEIEHSVPVHERCETEIEIIPMKEFYLKQLPFKEEIKKLSKEIEFIPERYRKNLENWIDSITIDWPISRRRWYATEIPLWYCPKCGYIHVAKDGKYHQPWKEEMVCPRCNTKMVGETRVLDTWMDSSITIYYLIKKYSKILGIDEEGLFNNYTLRPQGYEIIRTWLYYTLLRVYQLTGKKAFDFVVINGMGLDKHGRKMSKRYGNVIEPETLLEKYGADTLRYWFAMEISIGEDYRINEQKIAGIMKFMNKVWNIANYISQYQYRETQNLKPTDEWIINYVKYLENKAIEYIRNFEFNKLARELYRFVWDVFANHYIELTKKRAKNNDDSAIYALYFVFERVLNMLSIFSPGIAKYLAKKLYNKDIEKEKLKYWGKVRLDLLYKGEKLIEFNNYVWKLKTSQGKKLKDPISIEIPKELEIFKEDLILLHNIQ